MESVGIAADNPQDFFIRGYSDNEDRHVALPYDMVCAADVDSLNFLAARLGQLDSAELGKLNAALQQKQGFENIGQTASNIVPIAGSVLPAGKPPSA